MKRKYNKILSLLLLMFVLVLATYFYGYIKTRKFNYVYLVQKELPEVVVENPYYKKEIEVFVNKYNNPDIKGILEIESLNIYTPVVITDDNEYYLHHNFNRHRDIVGSIFFDYRNINLNENQINIYGHSGGSRFLFEKLFKFLDYDFFNNNPFITLKTKNGVFKYEIVYLIITKDNYEHTRHYKDSKNYQGHLERLGDLAKYKRKKLKGNEDILVLQTCLMGQDRGKKMAIIAKKIGGNR